MGVARLRILEFSQMYVSGPSTGVNRPSPGSSAGARNASDKGRSSFSSFINHGMVNVSENCPSRSFFNLRVFIKE